MVFSGLYFRIARLHSPTRRKDRPTRRSNISGAMPTHTARRSTSGTATRDRLLQAAMEVFAARGYHGTTVDDIVSASATSKGAFYHYFSSKQDVFLTLMDTLAGLVEAGAEAAIAGEPTGLGKVEGALTVVLEMADARRDLVKILLVEAVGL